jgi:type IX secretion system PorP/SprF family membrane protein
MKRICFLLLMLLSFCTISYGQNAPYFRNYQQNWQFINPAAMDRNMMYKSNKSYYITKVQHRQEWVGFKGAPQTTLLSWEQQTAATGGRDESTQGNNHKFGGGIYYDKTDAFRMSGLRFNYSYVIKLNGPNFDKKHCLHLGVNGGFQHLGFNKSLVLSTLIDPNDLSILEYADKRLFEAGMGFMYRSTNSFYFGASAPEMIRSRFFKGLYGNSFEQFYFILGGYKHFGGRPDLPEKNLLNNGNDDKCTFEPSIIMRYTPDIRYINSFGEASKISMDANCRFYGFNRFIFGVGYNTNGTAALEFSYSMPCKDKKNSGLRYGITSNFPFFGRNPGLGTSFEFFASWFVFEPV